MTEQLEISIPFKELTKVTFRCKSCKGEMTLDLANDKHKGITSKDDQLQIACVFCKTYFDGYLHDAFQSLFRWYELAGKSGHEIFFKTPKTLE